VLATSFDNTLSIGTAIILAALGALAWFFRQWAGGVVEAVHDLSDRVDARFREADARFTIIDAKAEDARVQAAYLAGVVRAEPPPSRFAHVTIDDTPRHNPPG
jgi:hypothetical protein